MNFTFHIPVNLNYEMYTQIVVKSKNYLYIKCFLDKQISSKAFDPCWNNFKILYSKLVGLNSWHKVLQERIILSFALFESQHPFIRNSL